MEKEKEDLKKQKQELKTGGSSDLEVRQAFIYRENYFSMLSETYSNLEGYDILVNYLKSIGNPVRFYELIRNLEHGEKFKDISYMYEASPFQKTLNAYLEALGLNKDTEEVETKEGE